MYKISVPVMNKNFKRGNRQKAVEYFEKMGVQRVFLALDAYETDEIKQKQALEELKENTVYLKSKGFEVGAWIWTFWIRENNDYTHMKFTSGEVSKEYICPSDEKFREFAGNYVKKIAMCGVDLIMYDDDYRYGYLGNGFGCICKNHIKYIEDILGEKLPENWVENYLLSGGENKYRSAFLKANRHFMLKFAEDMRKNLDEINPDIRFGLCACMSVWDFDGASPNEISEKLAGKTKPFLRLIGAPYWAVNKAWGNRLQDVIELERMARSWCKNSDMEIFAEGDVFPRPRFNCPASYLEGFDTALRADGNFDGILKYVFDYTSTMNYETGYIAKHMDNEDLYIEIEKLFADKEAVGVRVYDEMRKFEHMDIPKAAKGKNLLDMFFSPAARMLAACSIPTVYSGKGLCTIAFGENAKYISDEAFESGLILDARAAEILTEKGIDVGIEEKICEIAAKEEHFIDENEFVFSDFTGGAYKYKLNLNAQIQSWFINDGEKNPASYVYENSNGQRFFVFTFDGYFMPECLYRQYTRSRQIAKNIKWLSGENLPAYAGGNPDLYVMTKADSKSFSIGLWNFFADYIQKPEIILDKEYKSIKFIGCTGTLDGNKVTLSKLDAFGFAGFQVW